MADEVKAGAKTGPELSLPNPPSAPSPKLESGDAGLRLAILEALREIEGTVAAQWMNEKYNDGARAAAQVLRSKLGLTETEPVPAAREAP